MSYKINNGQKTIIEFLSPFGELAPDNRWLRLAGMIPWEHFEKKYAKRFCPDNGAPAICFRMALGTLLIRQMNDFSDEETLQAIVENPYMQAFIGLPSFVTEAPFCTSSIVNFRKYISADMINEVNAIMFRGGKNAEDTEDVDNDGVGKDDDGQGGGEKSGGDGAGESGDRSGASSEPENKGTLILDATCAPAWMAFPLDPRLLAEARVKLEGMVDVLWACTGDAKRLRMYRRSARKVYLRFAKQKKPTRKQIRRAVRQQLNYVRRDLGYVDVLLARVGEGALSERQRGWLATIRTLYAQQLEMYEKRTHRVDDRIVSISQPHVRPIVRGKARAPVEFGAKVSVSVVGGNVFLDRLSWDAYNEGGDLVGCVEAYYRCYGYYPERVLVDKIYRNRDNIRYCKGHGIRISGPRLGRPPKECDSSVLVVERADSGDRNVVEGKIGEGKTCYGLGQVMARLRGSSEVVIS